MANQAVSGNNLHKPGDYSLERCVITSLVTGAFVDISNLFTKIEIYEDIFSHTLTAKIIVEDAYNFPERLPISGQEKVELSFKTDLDNFEPVELVFRVYKFDSQVIGETGKVQQYVLHLMSEGGYFDYTEYCGYALVGSVGEMVGSVFSKHFPEAVWKDRLEVEPTKDNYSFVLPQSNTPFRSINWLASKAHAKTGKDYSPYLFYETMDGHRFKSLSKIMEDGSAAPMSYIYSMGNNRALPYEQERSQLPEGADSSMPVRYHKIQELEELERFDAVSSIMNGLISSRVRVHDLLRKQVRDVEFFENGVFETMRKLGDKPRFKPEDPESDRLLKRAAVYNYMPTTPYTVDSKSNPLIDNFKVESLFLPRKYHLGSFLTQKLAATVFGDSRRRVGDVVNLSVPKIQSDSPYLQGETDPNMSGQFMITGIRHTLTNTYTVKMELSRNCMGV
jgi:hypothetical protein